MQKPSTRKVIAKACDACRRRKVKCDGLQPCAGCLSADVVCTYDTPRGQGGNRGVRATVLNELRSKNQQQDQYQHPLSRSIPDKSHWNNATRTLPESATLDAYIHLYVKRIHPVVPLLHVATIRAQGNQAETSPISCRFILAFCAYVSTFGMILSDYEMEGSLGFGGNSGRHLLESAMSINDYSRMTQPTALSVYTSFFLYGAWASQGDYNQAWFYLRETTTLFLLLKSQVDEWYDQKAQRCLFWILVVSERSHAVRKSRPITIPVLDSSPSLDEINEIGLQYLASLFRPFNEVFFAIWNGASRDCSKEWLLQLEYEVRCALPSTFNVSDDEKANLQISQLWLQIKLWELFPRFGFLSSESPHECLTFQYPASVARQLLITTTHLSISSLQVHGVGMTEKVFDIACALADIYPFILSPTNTTAVEFLTQIISLLMQLPGGRSKFLPLLLTKVHEIHPDLAKMLSDTIEIPLAAFNDPMSPNTRFIYEEEVGRGLYSDLRRGR